MILRGPKDVKDDNPRASRGGLMETIRTTFPCIVFYRRPARRPAARTARRCDGWSAGEAPNVNPPTSAWCPACRVESCAGRTNEAMKTRPSSIPLYSLSDVSRYARAQSQLVRRLYLGYRAGSLTRPPVLGSTVNRARSAPLSFDDLIETAVTASLRSCGISLQAVRAAHQVAAAEVGDHPFARRDILVAGHDIFMRAREALEEHPDNLATLTQGGQRALQPVLAEYLQQIDWQDRWPIEWRPKGGVVRQNPEVEFGLPQVRGVRTEIIRGRFEAEEPIDVIADDFGLSSDDVQHALRYELWLRPAA